jgi:hypothetical protein
MSTVTIEEAMAAGWPAQIGNNAGITQATDVESEL